MESPERVRLYVWQVPVRVTHWVIVACIVILSVTGVYIADPFLIPAGGNVMKRPPAMKLSINNRPASRAKPRDSRSI